MNIFRVASKCFTYGKRAIKGIVKAKPLKAKNIECLTLKPIEHDIVQISKPLTEGTTFGATKAAQGITSSAEKATTKALSTTTTESTKIAQTIPISHVETTENPILRAAQRVTDDKEVQEALVELTKKEGIIIRTKEDAIPILRKQYQELPAECKENLYVLNINPQTNNGMPKSNTLISQWYAEANGIDPSKVITLKTEEMVDKLISPHGICSDWKQGSKTASAIAKKVARIKPGQNPMSLDKARKILSDIKGLPEEQILQKTTLDEVAQAISRVNSDLIQPFKQGGYTSSLAKQIQEIMGKSEGKVYFVIPDDCSLSGSSILCDTSRIVERAFPQGCVGKQAQFIFSPMIYGEKAEEVIGKFATKQGLCDEAFLRRINAIATDGSEKFINARKVFENIEGMSGIEFSTATGAKKAVHFTETETFKKLGETNPVLQQKVLYLMQGPISESGHIYGGFGDCGVMVITPTEAFELEGIKYAGKVPTNSVGFMEAVGLESGVLNDLLPKDLKGKGLFIKGTGKGYQRYIEWDKLFKPTSFNDRIPIFIDGNVIRKAS